MVVWFSVLSVVLRSMFDEGLYFEILLLVLGRVLVMFIWCLCGVCWWLM